MEVGNEDQVLFVKMFGGFSLRWQGRQIPVGQKSGESQFACLMQQMLHFSGQGVDRDSLEEAVFGDRDINNVHHAMQSVIYNAKRKLKEAGLPDVNYITLKKGAFYWTDQIPVEEDAAVFERLYDEAGRTEDPDRKLDLYLRACRCYTGEFLPAQAGVIWAVQEARRYRGMFCRCVEEALPLLRSKQDYRTMEALGIYASKIDPMADWEVVTMEALSGLGRYEDAQKLYDNTAEYYMQEQGVRPSRQLGEFLERLGQRMMHGRALLDEIQKDLAGESDMAGGYMCAYPVFQGIYQMVVRMMERGGQSVHLMLCTVVDGKGNVMKDGAALDELSDRLGEAICRSIRHGDAACRYGRGQYLVLLINTTRENCMIVQKRINRNFIIGRQRTGVRYSINDVVRPLGEIAGGSSADNGNQERK